MIALFSSALFKGFLVVLAFILLNFLFGVLISLKKKEFDLKRLPKFLATDVFPFVGSLMLLALLSVYLAELEKFYYGAVAIISIGFGKEALWDKTREYYTLFRKSDSQPSLFEGSE